MTAFTGRRVDTGAVVRLGIEDDRIAEVTTIGETEADDLWIAPGLIDVQVNGYGGHDANGPEVTAADIRALVEAEWRAGVTAFCPTIITAPEEWIIGSLRAIQQARNEDPLVARAIPGVHVEGPYLAEEDGPRGAHDKRYLRNPSVDEFRRWQEASDGLVRIVTLAPERPGSAEYITALARDGVIASIGHTAAEPDDIARAVDAGARFCTHLGNGSHAQIRRHPNYIWAQLADDRLSAGFIADGHHLPAEVLISLLRAKGVERSVLVSDTAAVGGLPPGDYDTPVGGKVTLGADGRLSLAGTPFLAGAARSLSECVGWAAAHGRVTLAEAVRMGTVNPARLLDLTGRGELRVGAAADLTIFRRDGERLAIDATVVGGQIVHNAAANAIP
jgi:N-acetylglucosamine-6-phosphate deacetylase